MEPGKTKASLEKCLNMLGLEKVGKNNKGKKFFKFNFLKFI